MGVHKLQWSNLFRLTELTFIPDEPKQLTVNDEITMSISWLTAATKHDRKLLRCNEQGALLVAEPWSLLTSVELEALYPAPAASETFTVTKENNGVLIATSTQIVRVGFKRIIDGDYEYVYLPNGALYWFPNPVYQVFADTVPTGFGVASFVGVTTFI